MKARNISGLIIIILVVVSMLCGITARAQIQKKTPMQKKAQQYTKPIPPNEKIIDYSEDKDVAAPPRDTTPAVATPEPFDYEAFQEDTRRSDSMEKALGIFRMSDSMVRVVLKRYADTAMQPDKMHNPLKVEQYSRYYQQIVMKPYKGIWHVWYYFQDDKYHGKEEHPYHSKPKEFPYHFEIIVDQKKGITTLFKGVFSEYYTPE